jgi:hypothetical protein
MARDKATITVDRAKLDRVRELTGAASASQAIDIALGELVRLDRVRKDIAAYRKLPPSDEEIDLTLRGRDWTDLEDDTDWEDVYGEESS